jgi:Ca2+-binding EF-hand superfamily protein
MVERWKELWVLRNGAAKGRLTKEAIRDILKSLHEHVRSNASLDDLLNKFGDMYNKRNAPASASASVSEP